MPINRESRIENLWSSVTGATPDTGDFNYGELAVNVVDKKVYFKDSTGSLSALEPLPSNVVRFTSSLTAPTGVNVGHKWFDESSGTEFTYIYDGNSYQWVDIAGGGSSQVGSSGTTNFWEFNPYDRHEFYDFADTAVPAPFSTSSSGSFSASQIGQTDLPVRYGIGSYASSATASTVRHSITLGATNLLNFPSDNKYTNIFYGSLYSAVAGVLPSASNPIVFFAGYLDSVVLTPTDALYFRHDYTVSQNFLCEARRTAGGVTYFDSGVSWTTGKWYDFKIVVTGASAAEFYINDTLVASITSDIPRGSETFFMAEGVRRTATGGGTIGYYIDYIGHSRRYTP